MRTRRAVTVVASLVGVLGLVTGVAAATFVTGPLVQVSGTSAFAGCTAECGPDRDGLSEQRGGAVARRQPGEPEQPRRLVAAGSVVERRRPRTRRRRQHHRRRQLAAGRDPEDHAVLRRCVPAGDRPVGDVRPDGIAYQLSLSFNDVAPPFLPSRLRPCAPREPVDRRWSDLERSGDRDSGHSRQRLQRQADDHRRPHECELCLRGLGPPRVSRQRARQRDGGAAHASFSGPAWFARSRTAA